MKCSTCREGSSPAPVDTAKTLVETAALVRVISGELRGRRFEAPTGLATRPTSDRVREALFMALEPLHDLRVVDLFAGSGALGIEALSRGAAWVDFAEQDAAAIRVLEANLEHLAIRDRAKVWKLELPRGLNRLAGAFARADLVLADPPYGGKVATEVLDSVAALGCLPEGCRIIVEHHISDTLPGAPGVAHRVRTRKYGETAVSLYRVMEGAPPAGPDPRGES